MPPQSSDVHPGATCMKHHSCMGCAEAAVCTRHALLGRCSRNVSKAVTEVTYQVILVCPSRTDETEIRSACSTEALQGVHLVALDGHLLLAEQPSAPHRQAAQGQLFNCDRPCLSSDVLWKTRSGLKPYLVVHNGRLVLAGQPWVPQR